MVSRDIFSILCLSSTVQVTHARYANAVRLDDDTARNLYLGVFYQRPLSVNRWYTVTSGNQFNNVIQISVLLVLSSLQCLRIIDYINLQFVFYSIGTLKLSVDRTGQHAACSVFLEFLCSKMLTDCPVLMEWIDTVL